MVIVEIRAKPMHVMGWFDRKLAIAWRNIFLLTGGQCKVGISTTHGSNLGKDVESVVAIPGRRLASGGGTKKCVEGASPNVAGSSVMQRKPNGDTLGEKDVRSSTHVHLIMGNQHYMKIIQVFKPTLEFSIHVVAREMNLGVLEHLLTLCPGKGKAKEMMALMGWNLREAEIFPPSDECPTPFHQLTMNSVKL